LGGTNSLGANSPIYSICSDASGNIYAAGEFTNSSGNGYVAKYNGSVWSELGGLNALGPNIGIYSVYCDAAGNIYAAGTINNGSSYYVAKWNGINWSELGGTNSLAANNRIVSVCSDAVGNIYAAGNFTNSSGKHYVAKYGNVISVDELLVDNYISISPTPFTSQTTISSNKYKIQNLKVYDIMGQEILTQVQNNQHISIDLSTQKKGIYFVKLADENNNAIIKKIVLQ
jgi:Secretion system C-terminal sorting domain